MKIGFSFGRCIRDIVKGNVSIDDVAFVISATCIHDRVEIEDVISVYGSDYRYLGGLDHDKCMTVAYVLWDTNRLLQPRREGLYRHMQPEGSIWVDIFPTELSDNEQLKKSWEAYRFMLHMIENVDNEAIEIFKT
jgi:hypothetical protein